ncbi:uncharacterized protein PSFLO_04522 [Pseudozyma flocculosa]|uniref:Uncharacterized protein n=1 Tax=Pseudozyma flocculosa TaxID=84751 RepID=A0A5C3F3G5_9BASI|nr:uncharacterized protein PSFLO_04522 [Pseudozyma flocculosa]
MGLLKGDEGIEAGFGASAGQRCTANAFVRRLSLLSSVRVPIRARDGSRGPHGSDVRPGYEMALMATLESKSSGCETAAPEGWQRQDESVLIVRIGAVRSVVVLLARHACECASESARVAAEQTETLVPPPVGAGWADADEVARPMALCGRWERVRWW